MRGWMLLWASCLALISLAAMAETATTPNHIHAQYALIKNGLEVAEINDVYTRNAHRYSLTSTARPLGLVALFKPGNILIHSNGTVTPQGLQPQEFSYQYEADKHKSSDAKFMWDTHQLLLSHDEIQGIVDLPHDTQDRLSAMYQFIFLSLRDQHNLEFAMTNGSKLDHYHYAITAGTPCHFANGQFDTLYLDSEAKKGETRTQIWLATAHNNLPCKIVVTDPNGGKLTQELRTLETQP